MKKVLSALLAIVMIVSFFATGATAYADKDRGFTMEDAYKRYDNVSSFDHVDIRVAGSITVGLAMVTFFFTPSTDRKSVV